MDIIYKQVSTRARRVLISKKEVKGMLGDRASAILKLIIDEYIRTGEPIGSKTLCQMLPYSVSSATVRNDMAHLSELGLLEQRHTSGGRVPGKAAYRFYIDNLLSSRQITPEEMGKINEILSVNASDPERLLADAAQLAADLTGCASFYSTVKDSYDCVQGVELIPAGNHRAMIVLLSVGGKIKSSLAKTECIIDDEFKGLFYGAVNEFFIGTPLSEINVNILQNSISILGERVFDLLPVLSSLCSLCKEAGDGAFCTYGETNLLSHEELGNGVYGLLSFFADKKRFSKMLNDYANSRLGTRLFVGDENPCYELKNTATMLAKFNYNNSQKATLGVIGSTRIDYSYVLPRVDYITKAVDSLLKEGGVTYG